MYMQQTPSHHGFCAEDTTGHKRSDKQKHLHIEDVLEDKAPAPYSLHGFRWYVEFVEQSSENIVFIECYNKLVDDIKTGKIHTSQTAEIRSQVRGIVDIFIVRDAALAINIPDNVRQRIIRGLATANSPSLLAPAARHIVSLMQSSTLPEYAKWARVQSAKKRRAAWIFVWSTTLIFCTATAILLMMLPACNRLWRLVLVPFTYWSIGGLICNICYTSMTWLIWASRRKLRIGLQNLRHSRVNQGYLSSPLPAGADSLDPAPKHGMIVSTATRVSTAPMGFSHSHQSLTFPQIAHYASDTLHMAPLLSEYSGQPGIMLSEHHSTPTSPILPCISNSSNKFSTSADSQGNTNTGSLLANHPAFSAVGYTASIASEDLAKIAPWTVQNPMAPPASSTGLAAACSSAHGHSPLSPSHSHVAVASSNAYSAAVGHTALMTNSILSPSGPSLPHCFSRAAGVSSTENTRYHIKGRLRKQSPLVILLSWHICAAAYWAAIMAVPPRSKH
ncbi:hypothetical protein GQ54DRAFT_220876 [Martensiomyces pterosporus]|nr:hypothetical protein GQ54DRAFT_220876 [Martensiomyces pterosporus]